MKRLTMMAIIAAMGASITVASQRPAADDGVVLFAENVMIPMRDGVRLATDIYRPAIKGVPLPEKWPILLQRTPYNKRGAGLVRQARAFAARGYVVALQDDRGTYRSEGVQYKYVGMGKDGFDTIEWLARLPYTTGELGMWGTSYAAHTQASAAILKPPHLKTMVLNMGGLYNGWHHKIRNHGAFELAQQVGWAYQQLLARADDSAARALRQQPIADWIAAFRARKGLTPLAAAENFESYIFDMFTRADYDDYWKQSDLNWSEHYAETADIPMIHISGWYDSYAAGAVNNYVGLSKIKSSPVRLLVGPWLHGRNEQPYAGEISFGADAAIGDFDTEFHLRWFDRFLKAGLKTASLKTRPPEEKGTPEEEGTRPSAPVSPGGRVFRPAADGEPRVKVFVMGTGDGRKDADGRLFHGGAWTTASEWPLPGTTFVDYYFHADGALRPDLPASESARTTYTYDPRAPVPTIGGSFTTQAGLVAAGGFDQRERPFNGDPLRGFFGSRPPFLPLRARDDILVFQTAPLADEVRVIGPVAVKLFVSSTAVDTDFTAKLIDVYPPSADYPAGFDLNVTDGIVRARYRGSAGRAELMTPGAVYELTIEPFPTANVFKKGHRIRVDISSSNFPRFDVNPNTGEPLGLNRRTIVADNTVHHDRTRPSRVVLPIVGSTPRPSPQP